MENYLSKVTTFSSSHIRASRLKVGENLRVDPGVVVSSQPNGPGAIKTPVITAESLDMGVNSGCTHSH